MAEPLILAFAGRFASCAADHGEMNLPCYVPPRAAIFGPSFAVMFLASASPVRFPNPDNRFRAA
jgi:hypothetical protein